MLFFVTPMFWHTSSKFPQHGGVIMRLTTVHGNSLGYHRRSPELYPQRILNVLMRSHNSRKLRSRRPQNTNHTLMFAVKGKLNKGKLNWFLRIAARSRSYSSRASTGHPCFASNSCGYRRQQYSLQVATSQPRRSQIFIFHVLCCANDFCL